MCFMQNDQYTVGGLELFDTLTDLVEHYKRKGIEEISGNWVHLRQVWLIYKPAVSRATQLWVISLKGGAAWPHWSEKIISHICIWSFQRCGVMLSLAFFFFFHLVSFFFFRQPYFSTRVNAADIDSRVRQLDLTDKSIEGEGEKTKAGFWEEFDVRFNRIYLTAWMLFL